MKLFILHRKVIHIEYRNRVCSFSTFVIGTVVILSFVLPYCVLKSINPSALWDRYRLVYEQPDVQFTYRYLFLAEVNRREGNNEIITCSSFEPYNTLTEERQECSSIKVMADDTNLDGKTDKLKVSVGFNLPEESLGIAFYTFYFFLEAELNTNCRFSIPTFISLNKQPPPVSPFTSGTIFHVGHLEARQAVSLQCPFFMRNIKTHFSHNYIPNENFTSVDEFLPESIQHKIDSSNAVHFHFGQQRSHWKRDGSGEITINVEVLIGGEDSRHTALLYNSSIWQMVAQFWVQYISVLIVSLWIANRVKDWLFESFTIRGMEIVPWKEKIKTL